MRSGGIFFPCGQIRWGDLERGDKTGAAGQLAELRRCARRRSCSRLAGGEIAAAAQGERAADRCAEDDVSDRYGFTITTPTIP